CAQSKDAPRDLSAPPSGAARPPAARGSSLTLGEEMDEQLPVLKDFKALEAPPPNPEPSGSRYCSYLVFCLCSTGIVHGIAFGEASGVTGDASSMQSTHDWYLRDPSVYNWRVYGETFGFGGLALLISIAACVSRERSAKKKRPNQPPEPAR